MKQYTYIAIDLKSFYASVECRERGLDPLDTNLVVADESRTDKTICLAVTPSLKSYGISGLSLIHILIDLMKQDYDVVQLSAAMGTNINLMLIKLNELNRMGWQLNLPYEMCIRDRLMREHRCTADGFHQREPLVVLGHCLGKLYLPLNRFIQPP